jgi:uncharacterized RDD family membrane protein YckC
MTTQRPIQYAGFWRRFAAVLIDSLVLLIIITPLAYFFSQGAYLPGFDPQGDIAAQLASLQLDWNYLLINDLLPMVLVIFFWVRFRGTPGKQLMNCEVVDANTLGNLTVGQSILRYIGYFLSTLPLCLGFFWVIWDKKKRGFHDLLAHTVVIQVNQDDLSEHPLEELMKDAE